jgi:hypothetical protein
MLARITYTAVYFSQGRKLEMLRYLTVRNLE